jgi:hypothetical protein
MQLGGLGPGQGRRSPQGAPPGSGSGDIAIAIGDGADASQDDFKRAYRKLDRSSLGLRGAPVRDGYHQAM